MGRARVTVVIGRLRLIRTAGILQAVRSGLRIGFGLGLGNVQSQKRRTGSVHFLRGFHTPIRLFVTDHRYRQANTTQLQALQSDR